MTFIFFSCLSPIVCSTLKHLSILKTFWKWWLRSVPVLHFSYLLLLGMSRCASCLVLDDELNLLPLSSKTARALGAAEDSAAAADAAATESRELSELVKIHLLNLFFTSPLLYILTIPKICVSFWLIFFNDKWQRTKTSDFLFGLLCILSLSHVLFCLASLAGEVSDGHAARGRSRGRVQDTGPGPLSSLTLLIQALLNLLEWMSQWLTT